MLDVLARWLRREDPTRVSILYWRCRVNEEVEMYLKPAKVSFNSLLEMHCAYRNGGHQERKSVFQFSIGDAARPCTTQR